MVTCPFHNGGKERKPSFGIHTEDGTCHCFTCGWKGSIHQLAEELTGEKHWVIQHTKYNQNMKRRPPIKLRGKHKRYLDIRYVQALTQNNTRAIQYLQSRGIKPHKLFDIGYNKDHDSLVLFIRDLNGNYVYIKERSLTGKRFYNTEDSDKSNYLFGLYECTLVGAKEVWLCESEIDALTIWFRGGYAVAIGSATLSEEQVKQLHQAGIRCLVDGLDRDIAGRQGWLQAKELFPMTRDTQWGVNKKDINELTTEESKNIQVSEISIGGN